MVYGFSLISVTLCNEAACVCVCVHVSLSVHSLASTTSVNAIKTECEVASLSYNGSAFLLIVLYCWPTFANL